MLSQRATQAALILIILGTALTATGCAGSAVKTTPETKSRTIHSGTVPDRSTRSGSAAAASIALKQVGVPYRYGGADRKGFDCSGLVYYAYSNAGKRVARTTAGLWNSLKPVAKNSLQVGDVLFFNIDGKPSHVGLYLGRGRFVHAPSTGRHVVVADLGSEFYRRAFLRGGRTGSR